MTEEIINAMAEIEQLHVVARTFAFSFKGKYIDVRSGQVAKRANGSDREYPPRWQRSPYYSAAYQCSGWIPSLVGPLILPGMWQRRCCLGIPALKLTFIVCDARSALRKYASPTSSAFRLANETNRQ